MQSAAILIENIRDMPPLVDTHDIHAVEESVQAAGKSMFPEANGEFVAHAFRWARDCFAGRCPGYLPIDARYHDLEHTLQGTACMFAILQSRHEAHATPLCTRRMFELGLLAILLHDTGYLKRSADVAGTSAKYTLVHVKRSMDFAAQLLREHGLRPTDIQAVQNMISCTGVNVDLSRIPFQSEVERVVGFALGTGDLIGQMAADDYVEKLPVLYEEFAEAQQFSGGQASTRTLFASADDLMRNTPLFWQNYVKPKIEKDFQGVHKFLNDPYPDGFNLYMERIEINLSRLREQLTCVV